MNISEHQLDEDGEHDPDACEVCFERDHASCSGCRRGACCESLIIEVSLRDAEREPRIKSEGRPLYEGPPLTPTRELVGYLLNGKDVSCVFLDRQTKLCGIYETRPLVCRTFDCDGFRQSRQAQGKDAD